MHTADIPTLSWPQAMMLFGAEDADMVRRKAAEKQAELIIVESDGRISAVLYGPRCRVRTPIGFVPARGTIIGITK